MTTMTLRIDITRAIIQRVIDHWSDPEFWRECGCQMDSMDCAAELSRLFEKLPNTETTTDAG